VSKKFFEDSERDCQRLPKGKPVTLTPDQGKRAREADNDTRRDACHGEELVVVAWKPREQLQPG
jgi:hypothetical protein